MKKTLLIGMGAFLALIFAALILVFIDPFGLHIADRFGGDYNAALEAIPADSAAYAGVNLLNANADQWQSIAESLPAGDGESVFDLIQEWVETAVNTEADLDFEAITPWLGQYLGAAILDLELDDAGSIVNLKWVAVAESRDNDAADQFLADLGEDVAAERDGRLVFIGSSAAVVERAIAAQNGKSLADTPGYAEAVAQLPPDRFLTAFIQSDDVERLLNGFPQRLMGIGPADLLPEALQGAAVSLMPTADGVQIDLAAIFDDEELTAVQKKLLNTVGEQGNAPTLLPADTLAYFPGQSFDQTWAGLRETFIIALGQADFDESMELFGEDFGLNPDADLFPLLDGETAVALLPADDDSIAAVGLMETSNTEAMAAALQNFQSTTISSGLGTITAVGDGNVYDFETFLIPDLKFSYGTSGDYFLLGNDGAALATLPAAEKLADQTTYREVWSHFPPGMTPSFYINAPAAAAELANLEMVDGLNTAVFQAIPSIAAAADSQDNIMRHQIIIFVDQEH